MRVKRIFLYIVSIGFLSGCVQSTAMVGPAITIATTGNISQAGLTFFTNKAVKEETGMDTVTLVSKKIEEQNSRTKLKREFKKLVETNFVTTRERLILEDKSNTFN
mgnify:FL=1|tara:strand:+ start:900 stop:1217 length:318 start_codon:yes stop_codon:yes gene_type:complete